MNLTFGIWARKRASAEAAAGEVPGNEVWQRSTLDAFSRKIELYGSDVVVVSVLWKLWIASGRRVRENDWNASIMDV